MTFVYIARSRFGPFVKVGISNDPKTRVDQFAAVLVGVIRAGSKIEALKLERSIHEALESEHVWREWFNDTPLLDIVLGAVIHDKFESIDDALVIA